MDIQQEFDLVGQAVQHILHRFPYAPRVGLILGTGLGPVVDGLITDADMATREIPGMIPPSVTSHQGRLRLAKWCEIPVAILAGRIHYYEGHSMAEVVRPVRLLHALGCTHLICTNAAGGIHPDFEAGDVVLIRDHINLMDAHPLRGPNEIRWGPRFPDMSEAYDSAWRERTAQLAAREGLGLKTGVYAGLSGPSLETPAEYRFLHTIGADLVGMSAVPEVIIGRHMDMCILGISVVSNVCYPPERIVKTSEEDVVRTVAAGADKARIAIAAALTAMPTVSRP